MPVPFQRKPAHDQRLETQYAVHGLLRAFPNFHGEVSRAMVEAKSAKTGVPVGAILAELARRKIRIV